MSHHSVKEWITATRPWSFPASAMPVVATTAFLFWKGFDINWGIAAWALINIILFHAAGNTWSDYHDYKKGVDRSDTIGGTSITSGLFAPSEIHTLAIVLLCIATVAGIALLFVTGWPLLAVGVAGFILTALYPWLKYHALGDADIFLTYSVLPIIGTSFVTTGAIHSSALWLSLPIGLITVGILHINNTRDIEPDKRAGIKTFAMLLGGKASSVIYCIEVIAPFIYVAACSLLGLLPMWSLLVLLALKPAIDNSKKALRYPHEGMKVLTGVDENTAKLQLLFSLLLTVSLVIAKFVQ